MPLSTGAGVGVANCEYTTTNIPAFLSKLWTLVEDPKYNELIAWDNVSCLLSIVSLFIKVLKQGFLYLFKTKKWTLTKSNIKDVFRNHKIRKII